MSPLTKKIPSFTLPYEYGHRFLLLTLISSVIFLLAGGLYNISEYPSLAVPFRRGDIIDRSLDRHFFFDSIFSALLIGLGTVGFLRIYSASKYAYDASKSITYLLSGILIVLVAAYFLTFLSYYTTGLML